MKFNEVAINQKFFLDGHICVKRGEDYAIRINGDYVYPDGRDVYVSDFCFLANTVSVSFKDVKIGQSFYCFGECFIKVSNFEYACLYNDKIQKVYENPTVTINCEAMNDKTEKISNILSPHIKQGYEFSVLKEYFVEVSKEVEKHFTKYDVRFEFENGVWVCYFSNFK